MRFGYAEPYTGCFSVNVAAIIITYSYYVCLAVAFIYPASHAHAPYYVFYLWPVWLYVISPHYLINSMIFGTVINVQCVF
jgi:hypothetical protein